MNVLTGSVIAAVRTDAEFDKALQSKTEVKGFQQLIDKYLAEKEYRNFV